MYAIKKPCRWTTGLSSSLINALITQADDSTVPSLIVSDFITGMTPTSAHLNSLAHFSQLQWNYYSSMGVLDPDIGPYEALGLGYSSTPEFVTKYGNITG